MNSPENELRQLSDAAKGDISYIVSQALIAVTAAANQKRARTWRAKKRSTEARYQAESLINRRLQQYGPPAWWHDYDTGPAGSLVVTTEGYPYKAKPLSEGEDAQLGMALAAGDYAAVLKMLRLPPLSVFTRDTFLLVDPSGR